MTILVTRIAVCEKCNRADMLWSNDFISNSDYICPDCLELELID